MSSNNKNSPWIINEPKAAIRLGTHKKIESETVLIRILDTGSDPEQAWHKKEFAAEHCFYFLDVEETGELSEFGITEKDAKSIISILQSALEKGQNVIVHCTAGLCRSGAVVEVAVMMGFEDPKIYRLPNLRVKHYLMRELGWTYDKDEQYTPKYAALSNEGILTPLY